MSTYTALSDEKEERGLFLNVGRFSLNLCSKIEKNSKIWYNIYAIVCLISEGGITMTVTTRHDAKSLAYTSPYPKVLPDGRRRVYEEVFINPGGEMTAELANRHLQKIREGHDKKSGWTCEAGHEGVFKDVDGRWYAYRHHAKYA